MRLFLFLFLVSFTTGCITAPPPAKSRVLPESELTAISGIKRGKDYAKSGRMDLAELEFRRALKRLPNLASLYNDLGYVLLAQNRFREAETVFLEGLNRQPNNAVLRENLATALYRSGQLVRARAEFRSLIDIVYRTNSRLTEVNRKDILRIADLASVYRNLAIIEYILGNYEESVCSSSLAVALNNDLYETGQHIRLLLSLDQVGIAETFIRQSIAVIKTADAAKFFLDYGVALYVSGDYNLAEESLARVLSESRADRTDHKSARVLQMLIADRLGKNEEVQDLYEFLAEDGMDVCDKKKESFQTYWPTKLFLDAENFLGRLCSEQIEPVLSKRL